MQNQLLVATSYRPTTSTHATLFAYFAAPLSHPPGQVELPVDPESPNIAPSGVFFSPNAAHVAVCYASGAVAVYQLELPPSYYVSGRHVGKKKPKIVDQQLATVELLMALGCHKVLLPATLVCTCLFPPSPPLLIQRLLSTACPSVPAMVIHSVTLKHSYKR